MIYRKLSLFLFFLFSLPPPLRSGKIRETRASPYGSSSYGQDGTDFHDRRIFTAAYYELFPSFPPALSGLSATYDLPSLVVVSLPETAPFPPPRDRDRARERGKEENAVSRWSSPRAVISANVYDRANHVFHRPCLPLFPL